MRRIVFAVALFIFTCGAAAQQPDPKKKSDLDLIQGAWWIVGLESGGKTQSERAYTGNTFAFARVKGADIATLREGPYQPVDFTFSLDSAKSPKAIDMTTKGSTARGIFKLEGDDLTICMSLGGPRPTEFATKAGGDTETLTLKRNRWEKHTDKSFGFTVDFPGKPAETKRDFNTIAGSTTTTVYTVHSAMDRVSYVVEVMPIAMKFEAKDAEAVLESAEQLILANIGKSASAKIESEGKPFKAPPGNAGVTATREFTIATTQPETKEKMAVRVRLYLVGNRVVAQLVSGAEEATRSPNVTPFLNSFRTQVAKKKEPPAKQ